MTLIPLVDLDHLAALLGIRPWHPASRRRASARRPVGGARVALRQPVPLRAHRAGRAAAAEQYRQWLAGEHPDLRSVRGDLTDPQVSELALARLVEHQAVDVVTPG